MRSTMLGRRLDEVWHRLTAPLDDLPDRDGQANARQLAVTLAWTLLAFVVVSLSLMLIPGDGGFDPMPWFTSACILVLLFAINLTGRTTIAGLLYLTVMNGLLFTLWAVDLSRPAVLTLGFLPLLLFIASSYISERATVIYGIVNFAVLYVLQATLTNVPYLTDAMWFNLFFSIAIFAASRDRRNNIARIRESEQRYRSLLDINFEAIAIVSPQGIILNVNAAFEALAKKPLRDLIGTPIADLATPESAARIRAHWGTEPRTAVRLTAVDADGEELLVDVRTSIQTYQGKRAYVMLVRDLGKDTALERERLEYELRYRALFESNNDAIFIIDLHGNHITANQRALAMLGVTIEQYRGATLEDFVPPDQQAEANRLLERLRDNETLSVYQRRLRRSDGTIILTEMSATLVKDAVGKPLYIQSIAHDISERVRLEEQRLALTVQQERTKVLRQLIDDFSHHVRTPLANIKNSSYLMRRLNDPQRQRQHSDIINNEIARLVNLLDDLLTLARLEPEAEATPAQAFDLNELLLDLLPTPVGSAAGDASHVWRFSMAERPVVVFGDRGRLMEALRRILDNARAYTPAEGRIHVSVTTLEPPGIAVIAIEDTGIGIEPHLLPQIFESFFRTDAARSQNPTSTGLGLSISRKIVETHRGRITVESVLGQGTTFRVWLPMDLKSVVTHETLDSITYQRLKP